MVDYVVVGAGFAGSVIAQRVADVLEKKVLVVEKRHHIGGNCYDETVEDVLVHKYGPHLFHTNDKEVYDYLSEFTKWDIYTHRVLAFVDGQYVPIPFNLHTLHALFPRSVAAKLEEKLLLKYRYGAKIPVLALKRENDDDLKFLAEFVYEKIFKNYTAKQWGMQPEELDFEVTSRVPVRISKDNRYFSDIYQVVPREGYTKIFENMLQHHNIEILLGTDFKDVLRFDFDAGKIYLYGKEFSGKVIFTGMIDELFEFRYGPLPYRSLELEFEVVSREYFQKSAVVNYPNNYDFTRITEFKHIHPVVTNKTVILKEYPKAYEVQRDIPFYPFFTENNRKLYMRYKKEARKLKNLILLGRLAEYKYYDMDDVIRRALDLFEEIIHARTR